ncbi:MAG TPA: aromatic ring-hydroxylating dioxygenase subunit alpha [Steroidobacteraceae bacterium]|nr:aromatic ring-hydroxylating dioxygenase subunit alpha [Steroidobacteraceae bacterium]
MYINFWYPVVRSMDLSNTPQRARILMHDFVAYRDPSGKAVVLSDTCIHRGGSLAGGKCKDDGTVQCPYHGWRFNDRGECTRIPSIGINAKIPPRARVDSYPVVEKYGLVFAFLGDLPEAERPPILPIEEENDPNWRSTVVTFDVKYYYERSIENGLDPAHNEYVHTTHGYQGERESEYRMDQLEPHLNNPWGYGFLATFDAPPLKNPIMRFARKEGGKMQAGSGTYGPNHMWTFIHFSATKAMHQYMFEAPIDQDNTRVFLVNFRNVLFAKKGMFTVFNNWLDKKVNERNMFVAAQDIKVMNKLQPTLTPPSTAKELLMPHDKCIVQYREKLKEWESRGWKIDVEALKVARERRDTMYAIPSPIRHETKAWVLDPVPLVKPASAAPHTQQAAG